MKLEDWIKNIATYGPFALLILMIVVSERSRRAMKEAAPDEKKMMIGVYILNWAVIFGLVIYSVFAWKQVNLDRQPEIRGTIENLPNSEILSTSFDDLYLRRIRQGNDFYSDYEWMLVNKEKRRDGEIIVFTIDGSKPNSENAYDYELPILTEFYNVKVHLRRDRDDLYFVGQEKPLLKRKKNIGQPSNTTVKLARPLEFFTTVAYAQTAQRSYTIDDFAIGLESPDAIVRRKTRADLANQNQATALPWIDKMLQDPKITYRLKLGVIVALNNMPNLRGESLKPATVAAIQGALNDSDDTLRNEALSLAKRYNLIPVTVYEDINYDYSGRSQWFGPGKYRADKRQLGNLPNDSASSVRVTKGFKVRLCDSEGTGNGGGRCEEKGEGSYQLKWAIFGGVADRVSYIEVTSVVKTK